MLASDGKVVLPNIDSSTPSPHSTLLPPGLQNIELVNGCAEDRCHIEFDNLQQANLVRRHFLKHFGHRKLGEVTDSYADDAILYKVVNNTRLQRYEGLDDIRHAYQELFALHPEGQSELHLLQVLVHGNTAMAAWSAATPLSVFPHNCDTFIFDADSGKIKIHYMSCQLTPNSVAI